MIFSGIEQMGEPPFPKVLLHGLMRDAQGRKMSKSLGNGIDPMEVIATYGADALRYSLIMGVSPGADARMSMEKIEANRNFANKLWNASRFALMNLEDWDGAAFDPQKLDLSDKWILTRYQQTVRTVTENLENLDLGLPRKRGTICVASVLRLVHRIGEKSLERRRSRRARHGAGRALPRAYGHFEADAPVHALHHGGSVFLPARA